MVAASGDQSTATPAHRRSGCRIADDVLLHGLALVISKIDVEDNNRLEAREKCAWLLGVYARPESKEEHGREK